MVRYATGVAPLETYQIEHGRVGTPSVVIEDLTAACTTHSSSADDVLRSTFGCMLLCVILGFQSSKGKICFLGIELLSLGH